ncbi:MULTISPECIES: LysR family transcriptional regulator [Undibacterium]|jgi:DNA-binding transcriptional LysR family regulator|uniref:LysR family transcriptional regulator n=3 Tax=Undibacterium TaxID=401469 RepID=A0A6M4A5Y4_9BURK|nr:MULTISPECIES: LysR family transcriptional regulator [Undibacterium]AZP12280.1 LysR family transcriptional regulator [Undibacterium parvum]MBC3808981.1 LysR family transcriptional regulator [Undibacterium seohonense]QJQ06563.1 LysR family transcriptional regulator [Undibacterium piscinae]
MMDKIEIRHMRVFVKLVKEKNVSKVASETGLTQQAVSGYLKKLREEFKNELFLRQSNGLKPTDFAYELCSRFERVIHEFDNVYETLPFDLASIKKTFTIIANEYAQLSYVPLIVQAAVRSAPNIKFKILDFDQRTHEEMLASGEADILIGFKDFIDDRLNQTLIKEDYYSCIVNAKSRIPDAVQNLSDLSKFPHVAMNNSAFYFSDTVDHFLNQQGVTRNVIATLPCYTFLQSFLSVNDVIAFIPSAMARLGNFRTLKFDANPQSFGVVAAWHRRVAENPLHNWAIETILSIR